MGIINPRLALVIRYHDTLHEFWSGIGAGTTTLEPNILLHVMSMREVILH